jgi:hypothetical protein
MKTATTLLDEVLPDFDYRSHHDRHVDASPAAVAAAVERYDLLRDASPPARLLVRLRGLRVPAGTAREVLIRSAFTVLAERSGREVVFGTTGRFWKLHEQAHMEAPGDLEAFRAFNRPGWARAAVSLRIEPLEDGSTFVLTETRVQCVDEEARRRFAIYWLIIGAFSGWLRRDFLRSLARIAEGSP